MSNSACFSETVDCCTNGENELVVVYEWQFNGACWYTTACLSAAFTSWILYDFIMRRSRATPSKLMLGRTLSDFGAALIFLYTVRSDIGPCTDEYRCQVLGALFTACIIVSGAYYAAICLDLYLSLRNPFRRPASNSLWIHVFVCLMAAVVTVPSALAHAFEYRQDFQFCWTRYTEGFNLWNLYIVYVPVGLVLVGGCAVTYWSLKRLRARMLDETFELRWKIIRRQTSIVGTFTLNYIGQGVLWLLAFTRHSPSPTLSPAQPYTMAAFVFCGVFFDVVAWCAKDSMLWWCCSLKFRNRFRVSLGALCIAMHLRRSNIFDEDGNDGDSTANPHTHTHANTNDTVIITPKLPTYSTNLKSANTSNEAEEEENVQLTDFGKTLNSNNHVRNASSKSRPTTARTQLLNQKYDFDEEKEFHRQNSNSREPQRAMEQSQEISNALRREVIAFFNAGLVTGVQVTAWETQDRMHRAHFDTFDNFNDLDGAGGSGGSSLPNSLPNTMFRQDTDTHPALQRVAQLPPMPFSELDRGGFEVKESTQPQTTTTVTNYDSMKVSKSANIAPFGGNLSAKNSLATDGVHVVRNRRLSSYQYQSRVGAHSTVAISVPVIHTHSLQLSKKRKPVRVRVQKRNHRASLQQQALIRSNPDDMKYSEYIAKRSNRMGSAAASSSTDDDESSMRTTPSFSSTSATQSVMSASNSRLVNVGGAMSMSSERTMNAENEAGDDGKWIDVNYDDEDAGALTAEELNGTLDFDVNFNELYSESLLGSEEDAPAATDYPRSISPKKAGTNKGAVNRFNIGIAGSERVSFTDFAPHVFRFLRTKIYKVSDSEYLQSILSGMELAAGIAKDVVSKFSEGRSGAFFFFTPDSKYLIKTLTREEAQLLIDTLSTYVEYMQQNGHRTYLTKYYGLHSVKMYTNVIYFIVTANIFPADKPTFETIKERYDIKGSWIGRHTNRHLFEERLMKDEDLHRELQLNAEMSAEIYAQLSKDTQFLQDLQIMDYSLLLGVSYQRIDARRSVMQSADIRNHHSKTDLIREHSEQDYDGLQSEKYGNVAAAGHEQYTAKANIVEGPGVYYLGIIDMLQKWNTQKKMEAFLKTHFQCKSKAGISCVEPVFYRKRFLKKMKKMNIAPEV